MSNPILNRNFASREIVLDEQAMTETKINRNFNSQDVFVEGQPMTVAGTINKILILSILLVLGAACNWHFVLTGFVDKAAMLTTGGAIVGFIIALILAFNVNWAKFLAPMYAFFEGLFIGGFSSFLEAQYTGIVLQATMSTVVTLFSMLFLYKVGAIKYSEKFASILRTAVLSIFLIYLIQFVASLFGRGIPQIFTASPIGIGFSALVILVAAFSLIQDFHFIETGSERTLPADYEWYGAFGLMVTLVWLYIEFLRLFAKLNSRR